MIAYTVFNYVTLHKQLYHSCGCGSFNFLKETAQNFEPIIDLSVDLSKLCNIDEIIRSVYIDQIG